MVPRVRRYTPIALVIAVVLAWLLWPARRSNVLLISIDTLRPDFLSCYGGTYQSTPHIDAMANAGVLFTQAIADVPWPRASMASVLTGSYAAAHHVRTVFDRLSEDSTTMAQAFASAGYRTGAVVSDFDLDHVFALDRGFQTYDDRFDTPLYVTGKERLVHLASIFYGDLQQDRRFRTRKLKADSLRDDPRITDAAMGWLRRIGAQPFFLWVHYSGPRARWTSSENLHDVLAEYQPAIQRLDVEVGRLMEALAVMHLDGNTIVVLHADRGAGVRERRFFVPGRNLYDASVRVPLIMRWPKALPAGTRTDALVRLVDLFPTLAELVGVSRPTGVDGRSLTALLQRGEHAGASETYAETYLPATAMASQVTTGPDGQPVRFGFVRRAIRTPRWKYIRNDPSPVIDVRAPAPVPEPLRQTLASEELYDLSADPSEQHNLIDSAPTTAAGLRSALDRYAKGTLR